ncbi:Uncharacterised protein [uncultured archaeon]|nr:Uncharacterised protein [uncultured archaeon]
MNGKPVVILLLVLSAILAGLNGRIIFMGSHGQAA